MYEEQDLMMPQVFIRDKMHNPESVKLVHD